MLDTNLAPDRSKIGYIAAIPAGDQVIATAVNDLEPLVIPELADRFGIYDMLYGGKDDEYLVSLLYYLGVLTFVDTTPQGFLQLHVPNLVIRKLYVEQLADMLLPREAYHEASMAGLMALEPVQCRIHAAQEQLARYRQLLSDTYGERLRVRCDSIVALGYERLVYAEL